MEREVWDRFEGRTDELRSLADELRAGVRPGLGVLPDPDAAQAPEVEQARDTAAEAAGNRRRVQRRAARVSPAARRAIERRAMEMAETHYTDLGWEVEDVSATHSYDLRCHRQEEELHVEVKGTTSDRPAVVLTANEVVHARGGHAVALVFVSQIKLRNREAPTVTAHGGVLRAIDPWAIDDGALEALSFAYQLPA